ncbi:tetratricopeptide repeat protein [Geomonas sp. Red32]|uniref:tetratricopeptide repeat protein n=1 Tax=Geomonas sp. Red32 TaxID=2912856 RepID=UPI00202D0639|nr:tetratricopeptide repeat protein [Geomonas sp. Red32]MCM0081898.1 tetratricopeptide repeat protein [Geomonas sp. Red32]
MDETKGRSKAAVLAAAFCMVMGGASCVQAGTATAGTSVYRGDVELVKVTGKACDGKLRQGSRLPVEVVIKFDGAGDGEAVTGFFNGNSMEQGFFSGPGLDNLKVTYPADLDVKGTAHSLSLALSGNEATGALHEKYESPVYDCVFDDVRFTLRKEADGDEGEAEYLRRSKLFTSKTCTERGAKLLHGNQPKKALAEFERSISLKTEADPTSTTRLYPTLYRSLALTMLGRDQEAVKGISELVAEENPAPFASNTIKLVVPAKLCEFVKDASDPSLTKAATTLLDELAVEFDTTPVISSGLSACFASLGDRERDAQGAPEKILEYYQKALDLDPGNIEVVARMVEIWAHQSQFGEAQKLLQSHSALAINAMGQDHYMMIQGRLLHGQAKGLEAAGKYGEAADVYRRALISDPDNTFSLASFVRNMGKANRLEESMDFLDETRERCHDDRCRKAYTAELERQEFIMRTLEKLR